MMGKKTKLNDHDLYELNFVLKCTQFLAGLSKDQIDELTKRAKCIEHAAGTSWLTEGTPTIPALYVILTGQAFLKREGEKAVVFFSSSRFGQELLQMAEGLADTELVPSPYSIQAKTDCRCAQITVSDMRKVFHVDKTTKGVAVEKLLRRKNNVKEKHSQQPPPKTTTKTATSYSTQSTAPMVKKKATTTTKQEKTKKSSSSPNQKIKKVSSAPSLVENDKKSIKDSSKQSSKDSSKDASKEPSKELSKQSSKESSKDSSKESSKESLKESSKESSKNKNTWDESFKEASEQSSKDKKSSKESSSRESSYETKKKKPSSSSHRANEEASSSVSCKDTTETIPMPPTAEVKTSSLMSTTTMTSTEPIATKPVAPTKTKEPSHTTTTTTTTLDSPEDIHSTNKKEDKLTTPKKGSFLKEKKVSSSDPSTCPAVSAATLSTTSTLPPVAVGRFKTSRRSSLNNTSTHSVDSTGVKKAPRRSSLFTGSLHQKPLASAPAAAPQSPKKITARSDMSWLKQNRNSPIKTTTHVVGKLGDSCFGCRLDDDSFGFLASSSHHSAGEADVIREVPSHPVPSRQRREESENGHTRESEDQEMDVFDLVLDPSAKMTLEESMQGSKLDGSMQGSKLSFEGSKTRFQISLSKFENANMENSLDASSRSFAPDVPRKMRIRPKIETPKQEEAVVVESVRTEAKAEIEEVEPTKPMQPISSFNDDAKLAIGENENLPDTTSPVKNDPPRSDKTDNKIGKISPTPMKDLPAPNKSTNRIGKLQSNFEARKIAHNTGENPPHRPRPPANVEQKPLKVKATYKPPQYEKSQQEERQISRALSSCFAFKSMPKKNMKALIAAFERQDVEAGTEVVSGQNVNDDNLYVVADGEVSVTVDNDHVASVKSGEIFGEENLFHAPTVKRDVSIVATMKTNLFKVNQKEYRSILQIETKALERRKRELLERLPCLRTTSQEDKRKIANVMKHATFDKGKSIPTEGEGGKMFYVIDEGTVRCCQKSDEAGRAVAAGHAFGEKPFVKPGSGEDSVQAIAETEVSAFFIDMASFEKAVGPVTNVMAVDREAQVKGLESIVRTNKALRFVKQKDFTELERRTLLSCFKDCSFEKGDIILEAKKEVPACLYFLRHGMVEAHGSGRQTTVNFIISGMVFAEKLFTSAKNANSDTGESPERFVAGEKCALSMLLVKDYLRIQKEFSQKKERAKAVIQAMRSSEESESSESESSDSESDGEDNTTVEKQKKESIKLENLEKKTILGEGGFGQVWLVKDMTASDPKGYALKIQSKHELILSGDAQVAVREKNIMAALSHPNVIKLLASYQDTDFLYFLLDLVQGGELYSLLWPVDGDGDDPVILPEDQAKFYALGIADALAHVHEKGFVYRDMKPENVMIDAQGYPVLVDFGLAKYIENGEKTFTLRGTPGYLPPECILNVGHSFSADHWSMGVLIYELLCGDSPFFFFGIEQVELYRSIAEDDYPAPKSLSAAAVSMIGGLLTKDPSMRLGSLEKGEIDIVNHEWFDGLDVYSMRQRKLEAPWKPNVKDPFDTSSFENWEDLEDKTKQNFPALQPKDAKIFEYF
uniref:cGMP-dependent protein kinase n=1 Tax=Amphora coffeiformis TaxID=265554 RepID=A0A7S3L968_9STRA